MPRYNVELPDGNWQVFSTIVDGFVTDPMTFFELVRYRRREYGCFSDEETFSLLTDKPLVNRMSYKEACERMRYEVD